MFKFICVYIQVEAYHNKQVTQKMGTNRKYVKRDKKEAGPKEDSEDNEDKEDKAEEPLASEDNEDKEEPAEDSADPSEASEQEKEKEVKPKTNKRSSRAASKNREPTKTCYKCKATPESGACQHECCMSNCMEACCGPINGCSILLESDTDKVYFCHHCWAKVFQNKSNKKHITAMKTGKTVSKFMFTCSKSLKKFTDLAGVV